MAIGSIKIILFSKPSKLRGLPVLALSKTMFCHAALSALARPKGKQVVAKINRINMKWVLLIVFLVKVCKVKIAKGSRVANCDCNTIDFEISSESTVLR